MEQDQVDIAEDVFWDHAGGGLEKGRSGVNSESGNYLKGLNEGSGRMQTEQLSRPGSAETTRGGRAFPTWQSAAPRGPAMPHLVCPFTVYILLSGGLRAIFEKTLSSPVGWPQHLLGRAVIVNVRAASWTPSSVPHCHHHATPITVLREGVSKWASLSPPTSSLFQIGLTI